MSDTRVARLGPDRRQRHRRHPDDPRDQCAARCPGGGGGQRQRRAGTAARRRSCDPQRLRYAGGAARRSGGRCRLHQLDQRATPGAGPRRRPRRQARALREAAGPDASPTHVGWSTPATRPGWCSAPTTTCGTLTSIRTLQRLVADWRDRHAAGRPRLPCRVPAAAPAGLAADRSRRRRRRDPSTSPCMTPIPCASCSAARCSRPPP